ncbi:MAG: hypothetical protein V4505_18325 [Pseudomonadota bacterium]
MNHGHLLRRRPLLRLLGAAAALAGTGLHAAETQLPAAPSLGEALAGALAHGQPLVVMASLPGCPYCAMVRDRHLRPALAQGLPVVQVNFGDGHALRDLDGTATTDGQWIAAHAITAAPTVLFFGPGGRETAERLVGFASADFYGAYLEQRIATARAAIPH